MFFDIVDSPDDGGFYGEIFDSNGITHHLTEVYPTEQQARKAVLDWIAAN